MQKRELVAEQARKTVEQIDAAEAVVHQVQRYRRRTARPRCTATAAATAAQSSVAVPQAAPEQQQQEQEQKMEQKEEEQQQQEDKENVPEPQEAQAAPVRRKRKLCNSLRTEPLLASPPSKLKTDYFQTFMRSAGLNVPKVCRSSSTSRSRRKVPHYKHRPSPFVRALTLCVCVYAGRQVERCRWRRQTVEIKHMSGGFTVHLTLVLSALKPTRQ